MQKSNFSLRNFHFTLFGLFLQLIMVFREIRLNLSNLLLKIFTTMHKSHF